jgi:hypothetical protein
MHETSVNILANVYGEVAQECLPFYGIDRWSAAIVVGKPEDDVGAQTVLLTN